MGIVKAYRFPSSVKWLGGRLTRAVAPGKPALEVATPPEFKGGVAGVWSPEDLLVTATASCYAVTLAAVAERRGIPLRRLDVDATGHLERRSDGRFGFVVIELRALVETGPEYVAAAEEAARQAEGLCPIAVSLDAPVHVEVEVDAAAPAAVAGR